MRPCQIEHIRIIDNGDGTAWSVHDKKQIPGPLRIRHLLDMIGAETGDTVSLKDGKVMIVDDTGLIDGKPINPAATKLYAEKCQGRNTTGIHGDVVIVEDRDFL